MLLLTTVFCILNPGKNFSSLMLLIEQIVIVPLTFHGNLMYPSFPFSVNWKHRMFFASCTICGIVK